MNTAHSIVFVVLLLLKLVASSSARLAKCAPCSGSIDGSSAVEAFRDFIELPEYQKSIDYTAAKTRFGIVQRSFTMRYLGVVLLRLVCLRDYTGISDGWFGEGVWGQALVLFLIVGTGLT